MRRQLTLLAATALVATACANGVSTTSTTSSESTSSTTVTSQTTAGTEAPSTSADANSATSAPERNLQVPDFTLSLSDGSTFTLSQERRPVYLLFWAEW